MKRFNQLFKKCTNYMQHGSENGSETSRFGSLSILSRQSVLTIFCLLFLGIGQMWGNTSVTFTDDYLYFKQNNIQTGSTTGLDWWMKDDAYAYVNEYGGDGAPGYGTRHQHSINLEKYIWRTQFKAGTANTFQLVRGNSSNNHWTHSVALDAGNFSNGQNFIWTTWSDGKATWCFSYYVEDAYLFFDNTNANWGTGGNTIYLTIGRYNYTAGGYAMTNISNTNLYYYRVQNWDDYDRYRFVNTGSYGEHNSEMQTTPSCAGYTAIVKDSRDVHLKYGSCNIYTFDGTNGHAVTKSEKSDYNGLNYTQTIESWVKIGSADYTKTNSPASITTRSYVLTSATSSGNSTNPTLTTSVSQVTFSAAHSADTRLTAGSAAGYEFIGWYDDNGELISTANPYDYRPAGATTIRAYYAQTHSVTFNTGVNGTVSPTGSQTVGQKGVAITASSPAAGYYFKEWVCTGGASVDNSISASTKVKATATGTVTANFAPRYELHGEQYSGGNGGMPGWDPTTSEFTYANSQWSFTTSDLNKTTKYKFKLYDRESGEHMGLDSETEFTNGSTPDKSFSTGSGYQQQGWFTTTFGGPYKFVLDMANKKISITYNSKTLPNYSSLSITQALNSAASDYVIGSGTSASHYQIYASMAEDYGKVDLTMDYSDVSTEHDAIYYSVDGVETGVMAESESVATATMSLSTSAGNYSPAIKAYGKVDDQYDMSYAANLSETNLYYDVIATPSLSIALKTTADAAITSSAGLEVGQSIKIVPTLSGAIRDGSYVTYSYRISGSSDAWTTIATTQATNSAYTWSSNLPTEPNIYTIKATYEDLGISVEATQDIVYWKDYTIYVWETGQNLNTANQNITRVHEYYKANSTDSGDPVRKEHTWTTEGGDALKTTTDLSSSWGGGWCSFDLKWPLYNYFIVGYEAYNDNQYQSNYYYLATKPEDLYLQCNYSGSSKWTWGASSIEEPQMPSITITDINIYATKLVVDVAIDNHYSLLTSHTITVNSENKDASRTGTVTSVGGGTYRYTLTNLDEDTDYLFRVVATNALGTTTEVNTISTRAKMPISFTIKVSSGLMAAAYWGANSKTSVKVKYWNNESGIVGTAELSKIAENGGYFWYKYTFEDSPISFYLFNANYSDGSGDSRSANWNDASSNGCAEVYDATDGNSNHKLGQPAKCGIYYKLIYNNGKTSTESNEINDESDKMSLFIGAYNSGSPAGRSLTLKKWANGAWDAGTDIFSTIAPSDSAVYVVSLKEGEDFENATSASKWDFEVYDGDYYIRTDHAPGGWNSYLGGGNKMTYSDYSAKLATDPYTHYWMKWVQGDNDAGRKVKFEVANDYNNSLSNGNANFDTDDYAYGSGEGKLKQNANVRFMYNSKTNKLSRAYLSGSSSQSEYFLVLKGNASNGLWTINNDGTRGAAHTTNGTSNWAFFKDNNNWIYQVDAYALPNTYIKLTAQMTNNSGAAATQYFKGDSDEAFNATHAELLIGGNRPVSPSSSDYYKMRVIYDFKTNRLMTAWLPSPLGASDLAINADVMLVRNGQGSADQITLNNHDLKDVHTVYAVMQFNRWKLNNRANPNLQTVASCAREVSANNWVYDETITNRPENHPALTEEDDGWLTQYERDLYWISFPFDVNLNEVFGSVGTYGTHWIIEYYDGKGRAQNGFWADSPSNWKFINNVNTTLKAYEGYILALDLDYFAYNNTTTWANNIHQVELYFPSGSSETSPIKIKTDTLRVSFKNQSDYQCHIDRRTDKTEPNTNKDRRVVDSYWHCIGVPSFHNVSNTITTGDNVNPTDPGADGNISVPTAGSYWEPTGRLYLYEWNKDNTLSVKTSGSSTYAFKSMWSYLVQYSDAYLDWQNVSKAVPNSVAARVQEFPDREFCIKLMRDSIEQDHTYVRLTDDANVTNGFEFNYDLCKEQNGGKGNIWTVTTDVIPVAGNSMPKPLQTTIVPVGVKVVANGEYTFSMPEGTNGEDVYLIDNAYGTRTNLGLMPYTVTLTAGTYEGRFVLELCPIQDSPTSLENDGLSRSDELNDANDDVRKVFVGGRLYIIRDGKVYDAAGQRVE